MQISGYLPSTVETRGDFQFSAECFPGGHGRGSGLEEGGAPGGEEIVYAGVGIPGARFPGRLD